MMRALSLRQPWAQLVALGRKRIETRSWTTSFRGLLAIHAAVAFPRPACELVQREPFRRALGDSSPHPRNFQNLPCGAIIAVATIKDVGEIERRSDGAVVVSGLDRPIEGDELAFGDFAPGRFGWTILDVHRIPRPVPCRSALGLWKLHPDVEFEIREQLGSQIGGKGRAGLNAASR